VHWQRIDAVLGFLQGRDASYTPPQYAGLAAQVWDGSGAPSGDLIALADEARLDAFITGIGDLPLPENPMWTIWAARQPLKRDWRLFSPPFRVQKYVFEQTTGRYVGSPGEVRALPSGIDLAAVLGSLEAYRVASEVGFAGQMDYVEQVDQVRNELSAVPDTHWTRALDWNWLYVYRSLLAEKNASYPAWMNTTAWKRYALQAELGAWTHVLHKDAPDVAEGPAEPGPGAPPEPEPALPGEESEGIPVPWGYVEPQPDVYARLAALTRLVIDGLESRLMLPAAEREMLLELESWLIFLQDAARRELIAPALTDEEYQRLGEWGPFVGQITVSSTDDLWSAEDPAVGEGYSEAVAVPLAVAGEEQLVEATGPVDAIYVAVERGRQAFLARGGAYAHYEFPWPADDPLDDARWRELLAAGQGPDRPPWVAGVVIEE
jgi:hypothetical protein